MSLLKTDVFNRLREKKKEKTLTLRMVKNTTQTSKGLFSRSVNMFPKIKNRLWSTLKTYGDSVERFPNYSSISQVNIFAQFD